MFDFCFLSIKFLIYKILSFEILKLNLYYRSMIVNSCSIQLQCRIVYDFYFFKYENTLYISYFSNPMISIWSDHEHYSKMSLQFIFIFNNYLKSYRKKIDIQLIIQSYSFMIFEFHINFVLYIITLMYSGCKIIILVHMLLIKQDFYLIHYFKTE